MTLLWVFAVISLLMLGMLAWQVNDHLFLREEYPSGGELNGLKELLCGEAQPQMAANYLPDTEWEILDELQRTTGEPHIAREWVQQLMAERGNANLAELEARTFATLQREFADP